MTTEDLMKLADAYARMNAQTTAPGAGDARQALLDALEALGREVARLTESVRYEADCVAAIEAERDTFRAELAAIRATQEPVAYWVPKAEQFCIADKSGRPFAKSWEPLYASPAAKDAGLVADAARYRWLTNDHEDAEMRDRAEDMGVRLRWIGKGAADAAIDAAMLAASPNIGGV